MSKPAIIGIAILVLLVVGLGLYLFLGGGSHRNFDDTLLQSAIDMNKTLPMMVDKDTRLDATTAGPGRRFTYSYTLINHTAADLDASVLQNGLRPSLIANYRSLPQMKEFREANVELHYQYKDRNGAFVADIVVSPKDF